MENTCFSNVSILSWHFHPGGAARENQDVHFIFKAFCGKSKQQFQELDSELEHAVQFQITF
jgi:hypothetical protein